MSYPRKPVLKSSPYHNPENYVMTPAALRARKPFFWKNIVLAGGLFALTGGIYWYTLKALIQDDFGDVPVPPVSEEELTRLRAKRDAEK
ncbi:hypothetical protein DV451_003369 [Geotrichum candidum]|uniref:Cytochrome c oxidase assembly factor 3 n=1 Tax=Geotrichum candidum TaxID=1173061 RepID=A0A0J9XIE8_GEOCN|nr:hypothetical protein DV451_003369 [Geotrichum candidum]KAI9212789.1 hypothetical protein DS838_002354 [Geotrichum bryndzae]KAF5106850.1 hypothetical protein DV453_003574 [Geotrichum candidum]KAF5111680.1 hypothetical protein DV452_004362 [Geotrichum candidum]KAF5118326.1 hypothetical protein DV454_000579 [Geotrichum candidum]